MRGCAACASANSAAVAVIGAVSDHVFVSVGAVVVVCVVWEKSSGLRKETKSRCL